MSRYDWMLLAAVGTYIYAVLAVAASPYGGFPSVLGQSATTAWVQALANGVAIIASVQVALHVTERQRLSQDAIRRQDAADRERVRVSEESDRERIRLTEIWDRERRDLLALKEFGGQLATVASMCRTLTQDQKWDAHAVKQMRRRVNNVQNMLAATALKDLVDEGRSAVTSLQAAADGVEGLVDKVESLLPQIGTDASAMKPILDAIDGAQKKTEKAYDAHLQERPSA